MLNMVEDKYSAGFREGVSFKCYLEASRGLGRTSMRLVTFFI